MESRDEAIRRSEAGDTWRDGDKVVEVAPAPRKGPAEKVVPVRLTGEDWEKLRAIAGERKSGPSKLLREVVQQWIQQEYRKAEKTMVTEAERQYDRIRLKSGEWVTFTEERDIPDDVPWQRVQGISMRMSSNLIHTYRAIVQDPRRGELFTVEYVGGGAGDPRQYDAPLRREVERRVIEDDWERGEVYTVPGPQYAIGQRVEVGLPKLANNPGTGGIQVEVYEQGSTVWYSGVVTEIDHRDVGFRYTVEVDEPPTPSWERVRVPASRLRAAPSET